MAENNWGPVGTVCDGMRLLRTAREDSGQLRTTGDGWGGLATAEDD
jgi:hypothetical protein